MKHTIVMIVCFIISFYGIAQSQCLPSEATENDFNKASVLIEYKNFYFTGTLINNSNEDGRNLVLTTSMPLDNDCDYYDNSSNATFYFHWKDETTQGASVVGKNNQFALLELTAEALPSLIQLII